MITRLLPLQLNRAFVIALLALAALTSGTLASSAQADDEFVDGNPLSFKGMSFEGIVNFVHPDSFMLVVDDYSFVLERVITFNGAPWSREQVVQRLEEGDRLKLELGGVADERSGARQIQKVDILN